MPGEDFAWLTCLAALCVLFALFSRSSATGENHLAGSNAEFESELQVSDSPFEENHHERQVTPVENPFYEWPWPRSAGRARLASARVVDIFVAAVTLSVTFLIWKCAQSLSRSQAVGARQRLLSGGEEEPQDWCKAGADETEDFEDDANNPFEGAVGGVNSRPTPAEGAAEESLLAPGDVYASLAQAAELCRQIFFLLPKPMQENFVAEVIKFGIQETAAVGAAAAPEFEADRRQTIEAFLRLGEAAGGRRRTRPSDLRGFNPLMRLLEVLSEEVTPLINLDERRRARNSVLLPAAKAAGFFLYTMKNLMRFLSPSGDLPFDASKPHRNAFVVIRQTRVKQIVADRSLSFHLLRAQRRAAPGAVVSESVVEKIRNKTGGASGSALVARLSYALRQSARSKYRHIFPDPPWEGSTPPQALEPEDGQAPSAAGVPPTPGVRYGQQLFMLAPHWQSGGNQRIPGPGERSPPLSQALPGQGTGAHYTAGCEQSQPARFTSPPWQPPGHVPAPGLGATVPVFFQATPCHFWGPALAPAALSQRIHGQLKGPSPWHEAYEGPPAYSQTPPWQIQGAPHMQVHGNSSSAFFQAQPWAPSEPPFQIPTVQVPRPPHAHGLSLSSPASFQTPALQPQGPSYVTRPRAALSPPPQTPPSQQTWQATLPRHLVEPGPPPLLSTPPWQVLSILPLPGLPGSEPSGTPASSLQVFSAETAATPGPSESALSKTAGAPGPVFVTEQSAGESPETEVQHSDSTKPTPTKRGSENSHLPTGATSPDPESKTQQW